MTEINNLNDIVKNGLCIGCGLCQSITGKDSIEISMGQILRAYQSGSIGSYNGLKLKADDNLYNYSKLSIKNNPRIDVMYSQ